MDIYEPEFDGLMKLEGRLRSAELANRVCILRHQVTRGRDADSCICVWVRIIQGSLVSRRLVTCRLHF